MKLTKIDYEIGCDVPGCGCLSTYSLIFEGNNAKFHICPNCLKAFKNEIKKIGV